jgi:hypothetical protein
MRKANHKPDRENFIGGSDARVIMGKDEKALLRLWRNISPAIQRAGPSQWYSSRASQPIGAAQKLTLWERKSARFIESAMNLSWSDLNKVQEAGD